jgi:hypothetical protein
VFDIHNIIKLRIIMIIHANVQYKLLKLAVGEGGARAEVLPRASVNFASALGTD